MTIKELIMATLRAAPGQAVTKDELIDACYGNSACSNPENNLAVEIHNLRAHGASIERVTCYRLRKRR